MIKSGPFGPEHPPTCSFNNSRHPVRGIWATQRYGCFFLEKINILGSIYWDHNFLNDHTQRVNRILDDEPMPDLTKIPDSSGGTPTFRMPRHHRGRGTSLLREHLTSC